MRKRCSLALLVTAAVFFALTSIPVTFAAGRGDAQQTQLSLQFKRPESEETVPPPPPDEAEEFAKFECSVGRKGIISGLFDGPVAVVFDNRENFYVLDAGNSRIETFDRNCNYMSEFGESGSRTGEFNRPVAMALDNAAFLYVVDAGNNRIQKFDLSGKFINAWGSLGMSDGSFNSPQDITFDAENNCYVADTGNKRIQRFKPNGQWLKSWDQNKMRHQPAAVFEGITALAYDDRRFGFILALSQQAKIVQRLDLNSDLDLDSTFKVEPPGPCRPMKIAVDKHNDWIYISDAEGNRLLRYGRQDGAFQGQLSKGDTAFASPKGLAVDVDNRRIYLVDTGNNRVERFYVQ